MLCSLPRQSVINWGWSKSGGHKAEKVHHHGRYERHKDSVMGGSKAAIESAPAITARPRAPFLPCYYFYIMDSWCRIRMQKRWRKKRSRGSELHPRSSTQLYAFSRLSLHRRKVKTTTTYSPFDTWRVWLNVSRSCTTTPLFLSFWPYFPVRYDLLDIFGSEKNNWTVRRY